MLAIDVCMVGKRSLCTWNGGFTPEAEKWSPGKLLLDFEIKQARAEGIEEMDLLRGPQPWKRGWATGTRYVAQVELAGL
jgi:CelD/BcsL family acetyltransferase involved in cellulose biosynthesis